MTLMNEGDKRASQEELDFWKQRWLNGEIGFHQNEANPWLKKYLPNLQLSKKDKILVPLCGKSVDMAYLREQGLHVIGVDISRLALDSFLSEQNIHVEKVLEHSWGVELQAENLTLYQADFFDLPASIFTEIKGIFDRAALIALPKETRKAYWARMLSNCPAAQILLLTLEYLQEQMDGPPFAVHESWMHSQTPPAWKIESLEMRSILEDEPNFKEKGLSELITRAYSIQPI